MKIKIKILVAAILAIMVLVSVSSCTKSNDADDNKTIKVPGEEDDDATDVMVDFTVRLPGHSAPKNPNTYALTSKGEDHVETIEVLLFTIAGYTGTPYYCTVIKDDGALTNRKKFSISLPVGGPYTVVLLGNSSTIVSTALTDPLLKDKPKADILKLLECEQTGKWKTTSDTDFDSIPMWGEIEDITLKKKISLDTQLSRMVAKVDVQLGVAAQPNFKLKKVHLYNRYTKGMVAPYTTNWIGGKAKDPSIPSGATRDLDTLQYAVSNDISLVGDIYTFEAPVEADDKHATCLVLEGEYADGTTTFYRIDFITKDGLIIKPIPLLRNHSYNITISDIIGRGESSADKAFEAGRNNSGIKYGIMIIDDSEITTVIYSGEFMLGFSQDEFTFSGAKRTDADTDNILKVMSNVPTGWKVESITDAGGALVAWLSIDPTQKEGLGDGNKTNISLLMEENPGAPREAYIHFVAGKLKYAIKVTQRINARIGVDKSLFDDPEGFGINSGYDDPTIASVFNITSNTSWTITPDDVLLSVDKVSGTGDAQVKVILQPTPYLDPTSYTLTISGVGVDDDVIVTVDQFGLDIYTENDHTGVRAMPDANFVAACKAHSPAFDGSDGTLSIAEAMSLDNMAMVTKSISSLKGIGYFRTLNYLNCAENQLDELDVTKNRALTTLSCGANGITSLNLSKNTALNLLSCYGNSIETLEIKANTELTYLHCGANGITSLDVSKNTALSSLYCDNNKLTSLGVSANLALTTLNCSYNQLSTTIDLSANTALTTLNCSDNPLLTLDLSKNTELMYLYCNNTSLPSLDLSNNPKLYRLYCSRNTSLFGTLDLSNNKQLNLVTCTNNPLLTGLNVDNSEYLYYLYCNENNLSSLNIRGNRILADLNCAENKITELNTDNNANLYVLKCRENRITSMDLSNNTRLPHLWADDNKITSLTIAGAIALNNITIGTNLLETLDVSNHATLKNLSCNNNNLSSLNVDNCPELTGLRCEDNSLLTNIDVRTNFKLSSLSCSGNNISSLDLTNNTVLAGLNCDNNKFVTLDLTPNTNLRSLYCQLNPLLETLDISKSKLLHTVEARNNPELGVIYVWWNPLTTSPPFSPEPGKWEIPPLTVLEQKLYP